MTNLTPPPPPGQGNPYAGGIGYTPPEFQPKRGGRARLVMIIFTIIGSVVAICIAGSVLVADNGTGPGVPSTDFLSDERPDITMTGCTIDKFGIVKVSYTLVNRGKRQATFVPSFRITDPKGVQLGTASSVDADVQPGATVKGEAMGTIAGETPNKVTCTLVDG